MFKTKYRVDTYKRSDGSLVYIPKYKYWFSPFWCALKAQTIGGKSKVIKFTNLELLESCIYEHQKRKPTLVGTKLL